MIVSQLHALKQIASVEGGHYALSLQLPLIIIINLITQGLVGQVQLQLIFPRCDAVSHLCRLIELDWILDGCFIGFEVEWALCTRVLILLIILISLDNDSAQILVFKQQIILLVFLVVLLVSSFQVVRPLGGLSLVLIRLHLIVLKEHFLQ